MTMTMQLRRGTAEENDAFTGAEGEVTYDTTHKTLRIHDGRTPGGQALQGAELSDYAKVADVDAKTAKKADLTGATFTGDITAPNVTATGLVKAQGIWSTDELSCDGKLTAKKGVEVGGGATFNGTLRFADRGVLFMEGDPGRGIGIAGDDYTAGTFGAAVNIRNTSDPYNSGGIYFYTRTPDVGIGVSHTWEMRNDGTMRFDGKVMPFITEAWRSSDCASWYRKWSDGWIEQGGFVNANAYNNDANNVTFPLAFSDTTYIAFACPNQLKYFPYYSVSARCSYLTTTSMSVIGGVQNQTTYTSRCSWYACGF